MAMRVQIKQDQIWSGGGEKNGSVSRLFQGSKNVHST
jgi:hypothetical protein